MLKANTEAHSDCFAMAAAEPGIEPVHQEHRESQAHPINPSTSPQTGGLLRLQTGEIISYGRITNRGDGYLILHSPRIYYPRHLARDLNVYWDGMVVRQDATVWIAPEAVYFPAVCT